MKVLHLITRLDPGGSAENTLLTCHHLRQRGWQAGLVTGPGQTGEQAEVGKADVRVDVIPSLRRDPSPIADVRALADIYRMLRRERPDVLHTHSAKAGVLGRWAGWLAGVPVIVHTPHGHVLYGYARGLKNWLYLTAERITAPISDSLVALSAGEQRESVAAGIGRPDQWVVIPSGVDVDELTPRTRHTHKTLRVGSVARLEHVKGIDILVRAVGVLATLETPDFEVLVWGDGSQREQLLRMRDELGVASSIRFVGTTEPVAEFLAGLDVYVQPSRNEGMGRALVAAQGIGLPVVASEVCGIPDVVRADETGLLVAPEDPSALARGIADLLRNDDKRTALGAAARAWIMTTDQTGFPMFSTAAMLWRLERLYRRLGRHA